MGERGREREAGERREVAKLGHANKRRQQCSPTPTSKTPAAVQTEAAVPTAAFHSFVFFFFRRSLVLEEVLIIRRTLGVLRGSSRLVVGMRPPSAHPPPEKTTRLLNAADRTIDAAKIESGEDMIWDAPS